MLARDRPISRQAPSVETGLASSVDVRDVTYRAAWRDEILGAFIADIGLGRLYVPAGRQCNRLVAPVARHREQTARIASRGGSRLAPSGHSASRGQSCEC